LSVRRSLRLFFTDAVGEQFHIPFWRPRWANQALIANQIVGGGNAVPGIHLGEKGSPKAIQAKFNFVTLNRFLVDCNVFLILIVSTERKFSSLLFTLKTYFEFFPFSERKSSEEIADNSKIGYLDFTLFLKGLFIEHLEF